MGVEVVSTPALQRGERVRIDSLTLHSGNPRRGDIGAICESLTAHGQFRPIVVQVEGRVVLAGNHTLQAAQALGWDEIDVVWMDVDDETGLRILLADNAVSDKADQDSRALSGLLMDLAQRTERGLDGTGYSGDDLDALLADVNTAPDFSESERDGDSEPFTCPRCGWCKS